MADWYVRQRDVSCVLLQFKFFFLKIVYVVESRDIWTVSSVITKCSMRTSLTRVCHACRLMMRYIACCLGAMHVFFTSLSLAQFYLVK